jgi:hypothetical protein
MRYARTILITGTLLALLACGGSGDGRGGTILRIASGPQNPPARDISRCATSVVVLQVHLEGSPRRDTPVESVTFSATGTGDDAAHISAVSLHVDGNGNGVLDGLDTPLGSASTYASDDGEVSFTGLGRIIPASGSEIWILAYDLGGPPPSGSTFAARIRSNLDIVATGAAVRGAPVRGEPVTATGPVLLSAVYEDVNRNGEMDGPDSLTFTFSGDVFVQPGTLADDIFVMDLPGTFGANALAGVGPAPNEVTVEYRPFASYQPNGTYPTDPLSTGVNVAVPAAIPPPLTDACGLAVPPLPDPIDLAGEVNPRVLGVTLLDANASGSLDAGDHLGVDFSVEVDFTTSDPAEAFDLPVSGDTLGTGAQFQGGGTPIRVIRAIVVLGSSPVLEPRGLFDPVTIAPGSPSGIDVTAQPGRIVDNFFPTVSALQGLPPGRDVPDMALWSSIGDNVLNGGFGYSVASAGDVNGDGFADVLVGAATLDLPPDAQVGKAYVFHGSAAGVSPVPDWSSTGDTQAGAYFGFSVASAGDVDNDTFDDIIIGASGQDKVFLFAGGASGLSPTPSWTSTGDGQVACAGDVESDGFDDVIVGAPGQDIVFYFPGGPTGLPAVPSWTSTGDGQAGAELGGSVASAGDVDGDGFHDIIVGAPSFDTSGERAGKAYLFRGGAGGPEPVASWTSSGNDLAFSEFGHSVASAGDVENDGFDDVIIGAWREWTLQTEAGRVYLFSGGMVGLSATPLWTSIGDDQPFSAYGGSVASAGDVNGDGLADVIIGAFDLGATGKVYLHHGSPTGPSPVPDWASTGDDRVGAEFGFSVASAGDVDGDGRMEIIVGARSFGDQTFLPTGKAYLYDIGP